MASILRSLFSSKSSTSTNRPPVKGHSYESTVALDPPVKGLYPVAGNGPNVLEGIQRLRAQRASWNTTRQSSVAAAPNVPRQRDDTIERPRTAPHDGTSGGGKRTSKSANGSGSGSGSGSWAGRTRSGFSTKSSPPSIFRSSSRSSRRSSIRSTTTEPPIPPIPTSIPLPRPQTYQPSKGLIPPVRDDFTPPFAQHGRTTSNASHKAYVDLLEAHSSIRPSQETSQHRTKASGVRNYGEDVADRNIDQFGSGSASQLDLNSPQFSYLKTVYSPRKRPGAAAVDGVHSRTSSALGHVLGHDGPSDDMIPRSRGKSPSLRSTSSVVSYATGKARDGDRPSSSVPPSAHDRRHRALSPLSYNPEPIDEEPIMRDTLRQRIRPNQAASQPRGRERAAREPPPGAAAAANPKPSPAQPPTTQSSKPPAEHTVKQIPAMPPTDQSPVRPPVSTKSNVHKKSKSGSVSYSTFPNTANRPGNQSQIEHQHTDFDVHPPSTSKPTKRQGMMLDNSSTLPHLEGVVDLTNTVDTDVTTRTLPAVTQEHVTPVQHNIREERITREIHTHEHRHRILPVLETDFLPPKHYIPSPDGKSLIEIPEPEVPKHKVTGAMNGTWSLSKTPRSSRSRTSSIATQPPAYAIVEDEAADSPVIGLARGDPPKPRSRANSHTSTHTAKASSSARKNFNMFTDAILTSKKEYMTAEGYPRTEYVWHHPPVFQGTNNQAQPVYVGAGLGDISSPEHRYSSDDDLDGAEFGAMRNPGNGEESLLFRDSGYGSQGMLPGLPQKAPATTPNGVTNSATDRNRSHDAVVGDFGEKIAFGRVRGEGDTGKVRGARQAEGEATKTLQRMKDRRRSSVASKSTVSSVRGSQPHVGDLVKSVNEMKVYD